MQNKTLWSLAPVPLSACVVAQVDAPSIPLAYSPNPKNAGVLGGLPCNAIARLRVTDARTDKTRGTRVHESKPLKAEVTTGSDGFKEALCNCGN